ncbi:hypothetical protein QYF61_005004 [Mycteria americana]|uniref:Reverse transcriptase domain-containing protein n=1 Tax=Mycteria americana TaxID=33587 RepID=A0AAN7S0B0_MYCAM|nr:hypothetical protein QYF61_005004 [Mycteria americana]
MAGPLSIIYQRSWESGEVPDDWKLANVIPIYKKGVREDPGNYRPVNLTSVPGKIMEKIILATDKVTHLVDEGKVVDVVFLDFSKAFDTVPDSILLDKLSNCGTSRFTVHWVKNWLKGRAQRVVVNVATSGWLEKRRLRGDLIALYSFLRRRSGEGGADLFSLVSSDRMCGNGSKLCLRRFRLDIRRHLFTKRVVKHWNRLPREVVDAPSLPVLKRHLDNALNNML